MKNYDEYYGRDKPISISDEEKAKIDKQKSDWNDKAQFMCRQGLEEIRKFREEYGYKIADLLDSRRSGEKYYYLRDLKDFDPFLEMEKVCDKYFSFIEDSCGSIATIQPFFQDCEIRDWSGWRIKWSHYEDYKTGKLHKKLTKHLMI